MQLICSSKWRINVWAYNAKSLIVPKDREHLFTENKKLVSYCLKTHFKNRLDPNLYEDCQQVGLCTLARCAIDFDESRGFKFATYAIPFITFGITEFLNQNSTHIKIAHRTILNVTCIKAELELGCEDLETLCARRNISVKTYHAILNSMTNVSISNMIPNAENLTFEELVGSEDTNFETLILRSSIETIFDAVETVCSGISPNASNVYRTYVSLCFENTFELEDKDCITDISRGIARRCGVSQSYVSRVIKKANVVLRQILGQMNQI